MDLYGSRARGTHRLGSDVDLLLVGALDADALTAIEAALEASDLILHVDVTASRAIATERFADEVARDRMCLFTRNELLAAAAPSRVDRQANG